MSAFEILVDKCEFKGTAAAISEPSLLEFYKLLHRSDDAKDILFRENMESQSVKCFRDFKIAVKSGKVKVKGCVLIVILGN